MTVPTSPAAIAVAALVVGSVLGPGCGSDGRGSTPTPATADGVAERRCTDPRSARAMLWERATLLGCAPSPTGGKAGLYAIRELGGPCLVLTGLPGGPRACGRAPSERVPATRTALGGPVTVRRTPVAELEVYGETAPSVRRVVLRYRLPDGRAGRRRATLIRAEHRGRLSAARVREPFGYFFGAVPPAARRVVAVGLDRSGATLDRLGFDGRTLHPTVFLASEQ